MEFVIFITFCDDFVSIIVIMSDCNLSSRFDDVHALFVNVQLCSRGSESFAKNMVFVRFNGNINGCKMLLSNIQSINVAFTP